jgi:glucokinase
MTEVVLGIDIGGTFTKYGLVDIEGNIFTEGSVPSDKHLDVNNFILEFREKVFSHFDKNKFLLKGIGIGAPNGNYYNGTIEFAPNLKWKGIVKLAELFENHFSFPTKVTNDANAAAMGEMLYGHARSMKDFIMITLGTGLGSGLVVNGKLVYGHDGFAGELGHTSVFMDGRECGCGKRGCLETYVSVTGIERTVFELLSSEMDESELRSICFGKLDGKMISEAALRGDKIALKAFDYTGKILGLKMADAVAHTSPEAIFIFGGLANSGNLIFNPAKKYFEEFLLPIFRGKVKILPSGLQDKNIAVLGAAALTWNQFSNH